MSVWKDPSAVEVQRFGEIVRVHAVLLIGVRAHAQMQNPFVYTPMPLRTLWQLYCF
jgi:hypothetical protein